MNDELTTLCIMIAGVVWLIGVIVLGSVLLSDD